MKNFITNNWFRMVIGTSTLIFSVGFFIRSITPSYANNSNLNNTSNVASTNGYAEGNYVYFIDNGYMYQIQKGDLHMAWKYCLNGWNDGLGQAIEDNYEIKSQTGRDKLGLTIDPITKIKRKSHFYHRKIN